MIKGLYLIMVYGTYFKGVLPRG